MKFNYSTTVWQTINYELPKFDNDFVLLSPKDLLTKDSTWINKSDFYRDFDRLPLAVSDLALRGQVNEYFKNILPKKATKQQEHTAIDQVINRFPSILDYFIKDKENNGEIAKARSERLVTESERLYIERFKEFF